ncbi:nucleotidyltransferase domain-containing protein [Pseudomonas yamanorum]|nr:nucleotidyltransferase domain-containing protein [Pseudomonas yamanorum]
MTHFEKLLPEDLVTNKHFRAEKNLGGQQYALSAARAYVRARHKSCLVSFITGSYSSGRFSEYSDVDIYVIDERVNKPLREQIITTFPIQVAIMDTRHLQRLIHLESVHGSITITHALYNAKYLSGDTHYFDSLHKDAMQRIETPPLYDRRIVYRCRLAVTNNLIKLRKVKTEIEISCAAVKLFQSVIKYLQLESGSWIYNNEFCHLNLHECDEFTAVRTHFSKAVSGDTYDFCDAIAQLLRSRGEMKWSTHETGLLPLHS